MLSLRANKLTELPYQLAQLPNLEELDVGSMKLRGSGFSKRAGSTILAMMISSASLSTIDTKNSGIPKLLREAIRSFASTSRGGRNTAKEWLRLRNHHGALKILVWNVKTKPLTFSEIL